MPELKTSKREYDSTRRQAQANETRRRILEAARKLFTERGYAGATTEAIAAEADVAAQTIYAIFKNKKRILLSLMNVSSPTGDEDHLPMPERSDIQAIRQEHNPHRQLQMFAEVVAYNLDQVAEVSEIMADAAKTEPELDRILQKLNRERLKHMAAATQDIFSHCPLHKRATLAEATDTVWALTSPEVFLLLTRERGWSKEKYAEWLADTLARVLLP